MTAREGQKFLVQKFLLIERGDHGFGALSALLVRGGAKEGFLGVSTSKTLCADRLCAM
jgi:hypothetical protein